MRQAYKAKTASTARKLLVQLASWLERSGHEDAAGSLHEGLEETLTVLKLGLSHSLTRSLSTTNAVENVIPTPQGALGDEHSRRRPRASSSGLKRLRYRRRVRS